MYVEFLVIVVSVILLIIVFIVRYIFKDLRLRLICEENRNSSLREKNRVLIECNSDYKHQEENYAMSMKNLENALKNKSKDSEYRYISIFMLSEGQKIVVSFDKEYIYDLEYFKQKVDCRKEDYISRINLRCTCFVDGNIVHDLLTMNSIMKGSSVAIIDIIDCGRYKDRGIGTCIMTSLCDVLKELQVEELRAKLSPVDYKVKDKLYHFYSVLNGFEIVKDIQENKWGLAVKKLI